MARFNVFVDESKPSKDCPWLYIGALIIPASGQDEASGLLAADRNQIGYHGELHFQTAKSRQKRALAAKWLDHILYGRDRLFRFSLLGVDQNLLERPRFGPDRKTQDQQMYARIFRMAIAGALRWMSQPSDRIIVADLFHDRSELENHDVFAWHAQWRMKQDSNLEFEKRKITFVDSDHRVEASHPKSSHMIQLADITTGAFRQCLDAPSRQDSKISLGQHVTPLVRRVTDDSLRRQTNSRYDHWRRVSVSFFPRVGSLDGQSQFYSSRRLESLELNQGTLF